MSVLQLHGVGVAFVASAPMFEAVSLVLERGFYGLVGANGAGKTTLLSVLAGELLPHEGRILRSPRDLLISYCRQTVDVREDSVDRLAQRYDRDASELRGRLSLVPEALARWSTLSPGERKRWQVAAALAEEPDVLLLDEPTNHLDVESRGHLLEVLRRFTGLCVLVSHDRSVLDALTTSSLRIHARTVTLWPGRFSAARVLWEEARAQQEAQHQAARQRVHAAHAQLDAARRTQLAASRGVNTSRRMKDRNDSDARGIVATTKAQWASSRAGRSVATARLEVQRATEALPTIERDVTLGGQIFANYQRAPGSVLFHLSTDELRRSAHVVLRDVRMTIGREDRIRFEGPNGAGKTTLLEALVNSHARPERILYLPQELSPDLTEAAIARVRALAGEERGRLLSVFAAFGSDPAALLRAEAEHLSPGEARKLVLAEGLSRHVWALVMDEPTNHMDLPSVERLEAALRAYPGAIVLVTHDDAFARAVTSSIRRVGRGSIS
jgi:ATPase subunit of ABC transporter with duplicated ATPase domains